ncbi:proline-rich receptor-like protein kinase PERK8 [Hibiscus syriacus]|uniref:proline-rich receptor-like protein kinase PERK8 n=1 Tax=Hibiscus syriacus TaxID=106335 RepID=UPI0019250E58|nr:proline-rich receptor-like protein kinase PERK8 [Hibiscus syriacus]
MSRLSSPKIAREIMEPLSQGKTDANIPQHHCPRQATDALTLDHIWKEKVPEEPFKDFIKPNKGITKKKVPELVSFNNDDPKEVPTDVPPLATHVPPVLEEGQGDTEEFLSSSSISTIESSDDTPPHFFTDEDFTPAPKQPEHDPIPSPVQSPPPVPTEIPSPPPVSAQQTPTTEQSTPAYASSSKKRYKRIAGRILQPSPSPTTHGDAKVESMFQEIIPHGQRNFPGFPDEILSAFNAEASPEPKQDAADPGSDSYSVPFRNS